MTKEKDILNACGHRNSERVEALKELPSAVCPACLLERITGLESLLGEIEAVSCGEKQIESDGVYDDSDGLLWIYKRIQALKG